MHCRSIRPEPTFLSACARAACVVHEMRSNALITYQKHIIMRRKFCRLCSHRSQPPGVIHPYGDALMCVCRWSFVYAAHKKCETQINSGQLVTALPLKCNFHAEYNVIYGSGKFSLHRVFSSPSFIWCLSTVELFAVQQRRHQTRCTARPTDGTNAVPTANCRGEAVRMVRVWVKETKKLHEKCAPPSAQATKSQFEYSNESAGKRAAGRARQSSDNL